MSIISSKDNPEEFRNFILRLIQKQLEENPIPEETIEKFFSRLPKFDCFGNRKK
jgi:hypothetical protein